MPRMNALGVPLLRLGRDISLTQDRWVDVDPSTFTPELAAEYENLRMRGLIGIHPDDNGGIPVGKTERSALPKPIAPERDAGVAWTQPPASRVPTPAPPADDDDDGDDPPPARDTTVTKDEKPATRRGR